MASNFQMNYYDYGKSLSAEGVMSALIFKEKKNDKHEYVDLGLPSGTLWATCNVGANTPEEYGLYFALGETKGYTAEQVINGEKGFAWDEWQDASGNTHRGDYKFGTLDGNDPDLGMTKYNNTDGLTELEPSDDAATANWGSGWRMPTADDFQELLDNTEHSWDSERSGYTFTSTANTNTLFFAAAGGAGGGEVRGVGGVGNYWSSSLNDENVSNAFGLYFDGNGSDVYGSNRCVGYSVRPVIPGEENSEGDNNGEFSGDTGDNGGKKN